MILQRIIYLSDTQTKRIAIIMREARRLTRPLLRKCIHSWLHFTVCVSYASCYTVRRSLGTTLLPSLREEVKRQEVRHHEASDEVISHTHTLIFFVSLSPVHPWIWTPSPLMHDSSLSLHIIQKKPIFTRHLKTRINQMEWQEKSRDLKALIISQFSSHTLSFL